MSNSFGIEPVLRRKLANVNHRVPGRLSIHPINIRFDLESCFAGRFRNLDEPNPKIRRWRPIPSQMFWAAGIALFLGMIFHRHKYGIHAHIAGDNPEAGRAMGINIERTKTIAFIIVGICSAIAAVIAILLNSTYYATMGEGLLLPVLASVFVGGTPVGGGRGTIGGLVIGAATVVFIQTGVIAIGLDGYYTSLGFGVVIVLSLLGHRRFSGRLTK
jgi:ribose/xylose/arabinose/galactoside ABC-type transport system permease subunit